MVSGCPSLIQVTVVAGEPAEMQVRLDDSGPWVNPKRVMLGGAAMKHHTPSNYSQTNISSVSNNDILPQPTSTGIKLTPVLLRSAYSQQNLIGFLPLTHLATELLPSYTLYYSYHSLQEGHSNAS